MCSHLFGGTGLLGLGHGGWVHPVEDIAAAVGSVFLGPEVGLALGIGDIAGGALVGGVLGAGTSALEHKNPLLGGALGAVGGAFAGGLGDAIFDPVTGASVPAADASVPAAADIPSPAAGGIGAGAIGQAAPPAAASASTFAPDFPLSQTGDLSQTTGGFAGPVLGITNTTPLTPADAGVPAAPGTAGGFNAGVDLVGQGGGVTLPPAFSPAPPITGDLAGAATDIGAPSGGAGDTGGLVAPGTSGGFNAGRDLVGPTGDVTTPPTPPQGGVSGFLSHIFGGGGDSTSGSSIIPGVSNNSLLPAAISGAGLLYNMRKQDNIPGMSAVQGQANTLGAQAKQLQDYVTTGTLPPGVNTVLDQVQKSLQNQIRAKYASLGMTGSTSETQDLNNAALQVQSQGATEALNLMNQGVSLAQLSDTLLTTLLNTNVQQNQQTVQSIAQLSAALAGGGGTTIKLPAGSTVQQPAAA